MSERDHGDDAADTTQFVPVDDAATSSRLAWSEVDDSGIFASAVVAPADSGEPEEEEAAVDEAPAEAAAASQPAGSRTPVVIALVAIIVGALIAGGITWKLGAFDDRGSVGDTDIGGDERLTENALTQSTAGDCLTWAAGNPGDPSAVDCTAGHRFEVAGPLDTSVLPGSEFGESAPRPTVERFAEIRDEQCPVIVSRYLDGRLDPEGRFSVGLMFPSEQQWGRGAREVRCGLQLTGRDGTPQLYSGRVAEQDQSFQWPAGTCIGIDTQIRRPVVPPTPVDCSEPHAFQTTGIVDLAPKFGDRTSGRSWPSEREQNDYLKTICPAQAERFAGGSRKLDATTLNTNWSIISEPRWLAGSRKAVCYLGLPDRGGFATLVGDARASVLINGRVPQPPASAPPGRALPTPVPLPAGVEPNPQEVPAPAGGG
ncbi:MAG: septum formation family protein [Gordonia sp. (in: high G+C Gram-positive bacteria)]